MARGPRMLLLLLRAGVRGRWSVVGLHVHAHARLRSALRVRELTTWEDHWTSRYLVSKVRESSTTFKRVHFVHILPHIFFNGAFFGVGVGHDPHTRRPRPET